MARRTLNAPRYDSQTSTPDFSRSGTAGPSSYADQVKLRNARTRANDERNREREQRANAPASQRKRFDKERERGDRQARHEAIMGDPLAQLQRRSQMCQEQYITSLRTSGILGADQTKSSQKEEMSELHKAYTAMMVLQAVHPLQRGLSVQNVSTALTMGGTMAVMSPNFREMTKDYAGQLKGLGRQIKDGVRQKQGESAQGKLDDLADKQGSSDPRQLSGRRAAHAAKWAKRVERMEFMQRGNREPFTENSAALTEVGLAEAAYYDMRRPGADVSAVMKQHKHATSALYDHLEADGVDRKEVAQHMRLIVGQRIDKDPQAASVFAELAHSRMAKTPTQKVFVAGTTRVVDAWNGDFKDAYTDEVVKDGSFEVRPPMDDLGHREAMARTMYCQMNEAQTPAELDELLRGYMVGSAVNKDPRTVDLVEEDSVRQPMESSRTMFKSMEDDGFDEKNRMMIYGTSVLDAMRTIEELHPQRAKDWNEEFGPDWNDVVKTKMAEYGDLGFRAAHRPTREQTAENLHENFERSGPIVPDAPRRSTRIEASTEGSEDENEVIVAGELVSAEGAQDLPRSVDEVEHTKVESSVEADFENKYASYLKTHLAHAFEKGGVPRFAAVAESLRLMNGAPDDSVTGEAVTQSFAMMGESGIGEPMQRGIYADGLTRAMQDVAADAPEVSTHLDTLYGADWANQQVRRIEEPSAYTPPRFTGAESESARERMLTEAMSEAISGDLSASEAAAQPGTGAGAVHMVMREYLGGESPIEDGVEDQQWHLRRARIDRMKSSVQNSGITPEAQTNTFATAYTHAVEQSARRSPAVKFAAGDLFSNKRNWQDSAYQAAAGSEGEQVKAKEYRLHKDLMGLPGSSSAHAQAEAQLKQDLGTSSKAKNQYEADRTKSSRKSQRQRENLHHNGHEVNSGRWDEARPEQDGPELG